MSNNNRTLKKINVCIDNIPEELQNCKQWILWRYECNSKGKQTKVPYSPQGIKTGSQKAKWDLNSIYECVKSEDFSGVGFSFKESDEYIGIDYDAPKDENGNHTSSLLDEDGEIIDPAIRAEVQAINSYTEISPSGTGLHVICKGKPKDDWNGTNTGACELYFSGRYFTVTGNKYKHSPDCVSEIDPDLLEEIYNKLNPEPKINKNPFPHAVPKHASELSEREIINKLLEDPKANTLYQGSIAGYKSHSEADEALCCKIAFFTKDTREIESIFRSSGLYRYDKWDKRQDYGQRTISNALNIVTEHYSKNYISPNVAQEIKVGEAIFKNIMKNQAEKNEILDTNKHGLSVPDHLLTVPGILGKVVEYYENTAPKSQPQFAVQTALAIGSVALGRRWVTDWNNYTSLYFINVGLSSSGKEHSSTVITEILTAAGCANLVGTSKYSSGSAVYSELIEAPTHIGIIDEFGRLLGSTRRANNTHGVDAFTALMSMWGKLHSVAKIPALSKLSLTKAQKDDMKKYATIMHPAITLMAMTTPNTFYDAITTDSIVDGFIPRFIIVESEIGRQKTRKRKPVIIDDDIKNWVYRCANAHSGSGNMSDVAGVEQAPDPILIPVSDGAEKLFDAFQDDLIERMNYLDMFHIAEALGKMHEIALRLSLIVAVSCGSFTVEEFHAKWAIDYVDFYSRQTVEKIKSRVSANEFEAIVKQITEYLYKKGAEGSTVKEFTRKCPLYAASNDKTRRGVIYVLGENEDLVRFKGTYKGKGGAGAERYIIHEFFNEDDWIIKE